MPISSKFLISGSSVSLFGISPLMQKGTQHNQTCSELGWEWRFLRKTVICVYLRFFCVIFSERSAKRAFFGVFYEKKIT